MPPMLTTKPYDYDPLHPFYFLDHQEEFYPRPCSQLLPEDIWKKFELLPSPPLSPRRRLSLSTSDLLDEDCSPSAALLQSFVIQDCMWSSSFAAATELERVVSRRLKTLQAQQDTTSSTSTSSSSSSSSSAHRPTGPHVAAGFHLDPHVVPSDCISPSVVLPHAERRHDGGVQEEEEAESEPSLDSLSSSSSSSESEEEEEVDVVTVDRRTSSCRVDSSPLVLKRSHINIHQHNYAAPQPDRKRAKGEKDAWSPRSDPEDEDRRRTHNVLERQRRTELRRSFVALRDQIPTVADNQRAAKVVILKRAAEFIQEVREDERRLQRTKDELRKRSRQLRRRLEQIRTAQ